MAGHQFAGGSGIDDLLLGAPAEGSSQGFAGDFYREPDDVVRGVGMSPAFDCGPYPSAFDTGFGGMPGGDFYRDDDCSGKMVGGFDFYRADFQELNENDFERFQAGDVPPATPTDEFFSLQATTVTVSRATPPDQIGNVILDFLSQSIEATVTKVRRPKYAIKATCFNNFGTCEAKIRVWDNDVNNIFQVEFQRRSGSVMAFSQVVQQATVYMRAQLPRAVECANQTEDQQLQCPVPPAFPNALQENSLDPLFDMAATKDNPELQAEAAAGLLKVASNENAPVTELVSAKGLQAVTNLLENDSYAILYPVAKVLECLARSRSAQELFRTAEAEDLLPKAVQKTTIPMIDPRLKLKLAQAVRQAVSGVRAMSLPPSVAEKLRAELGKATQGVKLGGEDPAQRELSEASLLISVVRA